MYLSSESLKSMRTTFSPDMVRTFDEVFTKEDFIKINDAMKKPAWAYGNISNPESPSTPFFYMPNLEDDEFYSKYLLEIICSTAGKEYTVKEVYANGHIFGTQGSIHQDSQEDDDYTFLLYSNLVFNKVHKWKPEWGGKTIFFYGKDKCVYNLPKPNTGVLFPAKMPHYAESTTRHFQGLRITVAWKLSQKKTP